MGFQGRPFISHEAPDNEGFRPEVYVTKGTGIVKSITPYKGNNDEIKTAQIAFEPGNLKYGDGTVSGWINMDEPAYEFAAKALETGEEVAYRIENQRRKKDKRTGEPISPKTSMYELMGADENGNNKDMGLTGRTTKKKCVGVGPVDGDLIATGEILTNPKEDPGPSGSRSAFGMDISELAPSNVSAVPHEVTHSGNLYKEPNPWTSTRSDGSLNAGSYDVQIYYEFYFFLLEELKKNDVPVFMLASERAGEVEPAGAFKENNLRVIVRQLLRAADYMQAVAYKTDEDAGNRPPMRGIGSHARAREILMKTIEDFYPLTENFNSSEDVKKWLNSVKERAQEIYQWSIDEASTFLNASNPSKD